MQNLVTLTYGSTNHFLVEGRDGYLLVDAGWARSLSRLQRALDSCGIAGAQINSVMFTHWHPDHAGLTQAIKRVFGARLLIHERQIPFLKDLEEHYRRKGGYEPIAVEQDDVVITSANLRTVLTTLGIDGQIVQTPGHSEDSLSLLLDDGRAIVGDLRLPDQVEADMVEAVNASWAQLTHLGMKMAYPSHASPLQLNEILLHCRS